MGWMDVTGALRGAPEWPVDENFVFDDHFEIGGGTNPDPPAAPSNLVATTASTSQINLTWIDNSGDETGFVIDRSENGADYTQIATPGPDATAYPDTGLEADTTYYYRVAAVNSGVFSAYSNTTDATTEAAGAGTTLVVDNIAVSTQGIGKGAKVGRADVVIKDDAGNLVAGALVNGEFTGTITETAEEAQTDSDGSVTIPTSGSAKKVHDLTFCVTSVTDPSGTLNDFVGPACGSL
jgi:hypothetical protein